MLYNPCIVIFVTRQTVSDCAMFAWSVSGDDTAVLKCQLIAIECKMTPQLKLG